MTKLHESFYRGSVIEVIEELSSQKNALRGEFVLVIAGSKKTISDDFLNKEQKKVIQVLLKSMKKNEALNLASKSFGIKKNSLYKLLLKEN
jgi:16S rRNA (cytidine1402-2'-O)-methyltransferase